MMPSSSIKQYKLMMFAALNADFAKKKGIDQKVAKEWHEADEKKKKEDPKWFYNLPDKFEKKKEEKEASMEGFTSWIASLVGGGSSKDNGKKYELSAIQKMVRDEKILDTVELREGKIDTKHINQELLLRNFNTTSWLSDLEKGVLQITNYANTFFAARMKYCDAMRKVYQKCEAMQPEAALNYALTTVPPIKRKLDAVAPPKFLLAIDSVKQEHGFKFVQSTPGQSPFYMDALTKGQVKKLLTLMPHLFEMDGFGDYEHDHLYWTLDDTDEVKWWSHHFPNQGHIWGKVLDLFPFAGDFYEYDYEEALNKMVSKVRRGCEELINKSVKM